MDFSFSKVRQIESGAHVDVYPHDMDIMWIWIHIHMIWILNKCLFKHAKRGIKNPEEKSNEGK